MPFSQSIRVKVKTNRNLMTSIFPRFKQFTSFYFEFSLAFRVSLIGCCDYLKYDFIFTRPHPKCTVIVYVWKHYELNITFLYFYNPKSKNSDSTFGGMFGNFWSGFIIMSSIAALKMFTNLAYVATLLKVFIGNFEFVRNFTFR